jgi:hypothetical protein
MMLVTAAAAEQDRRIVQREWSHQRSSGHEQQFEGEVP